MRQKTQYFLRLFIIICRIAISVAIFCYKIVRIYLFLTIFCFLFEYKNNFSIFNLPKKVIILSKNVLYILFNIIEK